MNISLLIMALCWAVVSPQLIQFLGEKPGRFARQRYIHSRVQMAAKKLGFDESIGGFESIDFMARVDEHGYPAEEHTVTTKDGYKLRIHRIPGSPDKPKAPGKPVVYFQHGLFSSSDQWILMGPESDFSYMLADAGYDVWLGNIRGNTYSRSHVKLSPDYDGEFWNFSYHEMALLDVTAVIDYILLKTQQPSLIYVGHSMGGAISTILLSTKPEYNKKIKLAIGLAPAVFWYASPLPHAAKVVKINGEAIKNFLVNARIYELLPLSAATSRLSKNACKTKSIFFDYCLTVMSFVNGNNPRQLNSSILPNVVTAFPAGASRQTAFHFIQNMHLDGDKQRTREFLMYDHGEKKNLKKYGKPEPPSYNLSNIVAPVALFYGLGDSLVGSGDVIELSKKLKNVVALVEVPDPNFGHMDFIMAQDVKSLLNDRLLELVEDVTNNKITER
ncbi:lipase 3-like isoform X2 [Copidosoma floridanum]|uniref:lipase 3-like isoform X2 n=1 Tax=Copidosoma floridanum TaxID=29053 RepID=UPI000C6F9FB5|nr:lipase 3-like isoform X2 [Copidosoma floridanum]